MSTSNSRNYLARLERGTRILADIRYHILQKGASTIEGTSVVGRLFGLKPTTRSLSPLRHPLRCENPDQFIARAKRNNQNKISKLYNSKSVNHKDEMIIKIENFVEWLREVNAFLSFGGGNIIKEKIYFEGIILDVRRALSEDRYLFFPEYTTIYEASLVTTLLQVIYFRKIVSAEPELHNIIGWLIDEVRANKTNHYQITKDCDQLKSDSFLNLSNDIDKEFKFLEQIINI